MIIFKLASDVLNFILTKKNNHISIGLVPTMGALHSGHFGLINKAQNENDLVVCSIFVNPTQFNDPKDFDKYPVSIENDIYLLEKTNCDILFLPSVQEMYPEGLKKDRNYDLGYLETILEGEFRPGHFQGVCQVVERLLNIIVPDKLYLGQKDFQQCMIIKRMVEKEKIDVAIIICPTQRENDGLAMSSRNLRLNDKQRARAPFIYQTLFSIKKELQPGNIEKIKQEARRLLLLNGFKTDYVEIANADTLEPVQNWDGTIPLVILAAVFLDEIRLIDNIVIDTGEKKSMP